MKSIITFFIFSFFIVFNGNTQDNIDKTERVEVINDFKYLYRYQNFYLSGQPTLEALQWLKSQGVNKIINLRSENENIEYSEYAYNEKINAQRLGFKYYSIPVDGNKDYTPENLDVFISLINKNEIILIHCLTAGRATNFFMAYLIKNKGYTINEAVEIGRNLRFSLPLEMLLDTKVSMEIIE
jgi:protein tyrosine phosphatase (PTP) superfamily phosphohydrolase (DUF442 family)